ncbi:Lipid-binding serum glycoprotein, C-terminal domain and Lipid-binding serum glycoprotein, N-terminal domain and Bactericidal permeability-increasing protein, alpha/beta domain-containing protein [Strongyloides ratti]|uniref:Lipid-binding serum glycoprotein, C-terminal domain and Lipid-binding serum glycoprotein, N-terminal domain and Bactericidal permeability-increasing protein, alpha/beta domain-containing protein n=1 Tax=Strongyloides ratti TaxID=34506 RepID=A0A090L9M5_STRRB|nr:Lipid-binding serum glycoprotein, C-terminal domain and Lipid-binding serum glycoprotein, N-terminal domain and Bactericidal permeability-increasing protein, alpha/beta domain-containing protein [Strongyloides ratti]CEF64833.1 Lipid-binding serum glycoprotein, C-terminal domain and Lipid-binding serum glycoprotein, N-terminal domain and Bactericidal permeability-increasing protein, alpha/beta domain-containing protein [Strongyloides ratti]
MIIKISFLLLLLLISSSQIWSESIGQIQVSKKGIEFFSKIGIEKLTNVLEKEQIPPYSGTGPKRLSYQFTDMDITTFKISEVPKQINLFGPKRITVTFVNLNIRLNVKYSLKYKDRLTKTDSGTFQINIINGSVGLGMDITNGEPFEFQPSLCNVKINTTEPIELSGKIDSWIYNEFNNSIKNYIKPNLITTLCDNYENLFTNYSKEIIDKVIEPIEVDANNSGSLSGFFINYLFPSNPFVDNKFGIKIPIHPNLKFTKAIEHKFDNYTVNNVASDKHVCIDLDFVNFAQYLSDAIGKSSTIQSLGYDLVKIKLHNKVQQFFSCGCNDKSYCISDIIPDLDRQCTNYTPIALEFDPFKLTNINIKNDIIHANSSQIVSFKIEKDNKSIELFKLELYPEYILNRDDIEINDNKISGKVDIDMCKFKLLSSPKLDISDKAIKKIIEVGLKDYIKKFVNTYLLKGIPLPKIKDYNIGNYAIEFSKDYMPICYDLI